MVQKNFDKTISKILSKKQLDELHKSGFIISKEERNSRYNLDKITERYSVMVLNSIKDSMNIENNIYERMKSFYGDNLDNFEENIKSEIKSLFIDFSNFYINSDQGK